MSRTIIITGGGRGIGEFISRTFHAAGDFVFIGSRNDTGLAGSLGGRALFHRMDVRFENDHRSLVSKAIDLTGRLDVYVNCAGFSKWSPIGEVAEETWNSIVDTNLKGTFWGCKVASEYLISGGCIINISSLAGKRGSANNSVYCASKFAVNGITQALAKELGPRGIRVNALCPVYVLTNGLQEALEDERSPAAGNDIVKYLEEFACSNSALNRLPKGEEVAELCLFLASEKASAVTGQCINVDCGVLPQ